MVALSGADLERKAQQLLGVEEMLAALGATARLCNGSRSSGNALAFSPCPASPQDFPATTAAPA